MSRAREMPYRPVAGGRGEAKMINMHGEGKAMADGCGWEALAMALAVWIMAAIAGRWHHG